MSTHAFNNPFLPQNPFFAPAVEAPVEADLAEETGEASYALVQNGPPVASEEVECDVDAVEITVKWGTQVLCVKHLDMGGSFFVGEGTELALPEETLGAARAALVVSEAGSMTVIVPPGATATVNGALVQSARIAIADKMNIVVEAGSVTFEIGSVRKGKVAPVGFLGSIANAATGFVGLSFLGHAAIVASLAMFMPKMGADDAEGADRDQILMMQKLLNASAERDLEQPKTEANGEDGQPGGSSTGEPHKGEQGVSGKTDKAITTSGRLAIKGDAKESQLSKKDEMALARDFGLIGLIRTGSLDTVTSPWGEQASGKDAKDAHGKMWASSIDDAFGYGFGLEGTGEGGGGDGTGVGLDHVHTVGNGGGNGPGVGLGKCTDPNGKCDGMGIGNGKLPGNHVAKALPLHEGPVFTDGGRLPPEVIQRVVRQNFGRFRLCYEQGLRTNPSLNGRVVTKFVIARDGSVSTAQDGGSDLPDAAVKQCIVRSFSNLSFPEPQGGAALVTYPLIMTPGES
jgi:hypothetical protein